MKIKITENAIKRKSVRKLEVKHSDAIYYRVPSITLQKTIKTKILFIWFMVRSFQQFYDKGDDEETIGSSNIVFANSKEFILVNSIDYYDSGHVFIVSEENLPDAKIIKVGTGMSEVYVTDEYNEPVCFVGSFSKINSLFDEVIPVKDDLIKKKFLL